MNDLYGRLVQGMVFFPPPLSSSFPQISGPQQVPKDHVWLLGDNPKESRDSRMYGPVHFNELLMKTTYILWPRFQRVPPKE